MKIIFLILTIVNIVFGCGCVDSGAASSLKEQGENTIQNLDKSLSNSISEINSILDDIAKQSNTQDSDIVTTVDGTKLDKNILGKFQTLYFMSINYNLRSRQMVDEYIMSKINAIDIDKK